MMSPIARAVPEEPTACCHCLRENSFLMVSSSMRAASFGLPQIGFREPAVLEILQGVAHAAHVQAFQTVRLMACTDNEFGGTATDIHHQTFFLGNGQTMRDAEIDQARFFPARHHFDREPQRRLEARKKFAGIFCHPQCIGADSPYRARLEARANARQTLQTIYGARLRDFIQ